MAYREHTVKQGDCISSIAFKYGFFPDTIWNDSQNSELKQERKNPNILCPGDVVYLRDKEEKEESCDSEQRHRFRRKGVPEKFRLQVLLFGEPRAHLSYRLDIDGRLIEGKTDEEGYLEHVIAPDAKHGLLILDGQEEIELFLGHLAPVSEEDGARARLANLGFLEFPDTDEYTYRKAIEAFQSRHGLQVTGEMNEQTERKLEEKHRS